MMPAAWAKHHVGVYLFRGITRSVNLATMAWATASVPDRRSYGLA